LNIFLFLNGYLYNTMSIYSYKYKFIMKKFNYLNSWVNLYLEVFDAFFTDKLIRPVYSYSRNFTSKLNLNKIA